MACTSKIVKVQSKACDSCRRLRVGCDREEPSCGRCRQSNHACSYQHLLKREVKKLLKSSNSDSGFNESTHLLTYRAFPAPSTSNEKSKPVVLKWVDGSVQDTSLRQPAGTISTFQISIIPSENTKTRKSSDVGFSNNTNVSDSSSNTSSIDLRPKKQLLRTSKKGNLIRLVSTITSINFSSSLPHLFQILQVKNFNFTKTPIFNLVPKPGTSTRLLFQYFQGIDSKNKETIVVALGNQTEIMPAWRHLQEQAINAHFRYENSFEVLFLGRKGFECRKRSQLLRLSLFLSGIRYLPSAPQPLVLELLAMVTNELRSQYYNPSLDTIQALLVLYKAYMNHLLNPLVMTCLHLATTLSIALGLHHERKTDNALYDLESILAYRSLFLKDTNSLYALSTHPMLRDDMYPKTSFQSYLKRITEQFSPLIVNELLSDENKCTLILSDFHLWDNCVTRRLVNYRLSLVTKQKLIDTPDSLEAAFRKGCITNLSRLYTLLSKHSAPGSKSNQMLLNPGLISIAINYLALRLHMWIIYLYPFQPPCSNPTSNERLGIALLSSKRAIDLHETFGNQPFFLSGSVFVASALLHLQHLNVPKADINVALRALQRLVNFEPIWSLSQHMQRPIRDRLAELGVNVTF